MAMGVTLNNASDYQSIGLNLLPASPI